MLNSRKQLLEANPFTNLSWPIFHSKWFMWRWGSSSPTTNVILRVFMTAYVGSQIMGRHVGFCQIVDAHVVGPSLAVIQSEVHQIDEPLHRPAWIAGSSQDAHIDFSHRLIPVWLGERQDVGTCQLLQSGFIC
jgi:hypothetical protein